MSTRPLSRNVTVVASCSAIRYHSISVAACQRIAPRAAGMYSYLSEITSDTQSCNVGYLHSGHPVFTLSWGVKITAVVIRSQKKGVIEQSSLENAATQTQPAASGQSASNVWATQLLRHIELCCDYVTAEKAVDCAPTATPLQNVQWTVFVLQPAMKTEGQYWYSSTLSLTTALDWSQRHAQAALPP